jgi:hypothetical protein
MGKRRRSGRSSAVTTESAIYDSATLLGYVVGRGGSFRASTPGGKKLGSYNTAPEAMLAVIVAAREAAG